jgi:hypothetical protein
VIDKNECVARNVIEHEGVGCSVTPRQQKVGAVVAPVNNILVRCGFRVGGINDNRGGDAEKQRQRRRPSIPARRNRRENK